MKRGQSGLSFILGIDKPGGFTSHDVVSRVRHIFGEKRVGHSGTLDPLATGVLPIMVGSATRLNSYLSSENKEYMAEITFGISTDTDDSQGKIVNRTTVPQYVFDKNFAISLLSKLVGMHMQIPPLYSAIKINGKRAYDQARKGNAVTLNARRIEVFKAQLLDITEDDLGNPVWSVIFCVSKGTYIRSLARDIGKLVNSAAHISALRRLAAGNLRIEDCVSLETLEEIGLNGALDVVRLLGLRFIFLNDFDSVKIHNGAKMHDWNTRVFEYAKYNLYDTCACTSGVIESTALLTDKESLSLISNNALLAIYKYNSENNEFSAECVFHPGVSRGRNY